MNILPEQYDNSDKCTQIITKLQSMRLTDDMASSTEKPKLEVF